MHGTQPNYPNIIHHGGASGVTGSCHQLNADQHNAILIDCGLFQGEDARGDSFSQLQIDFPLDAIKALLVTHVHIDHIGRLPYLIAAGYEGPIICSKPSELLLPLVIEDALKVGFTHDKQLIERFKQRVSRQLLALDYKRWHTIVNNDELELKVKLQRAGHILGSCYIETSVYHKQQGKRQRIVFSGDLGAPWSPLLPAPCSPYQADMLVLESTYGNRRHAHRRDRTRQLKATIEKALQNRGTVIIPAFSIGRTQELLYELEGIIHQHRRKQPLWDDLEIIIDSPLAAEFTRVYRQLKPYWDKEAQQRLRAGRHPLNFSNLYTVGDHTEHENTVNYLATTGRPAVVIAASGMAAGGRVVNYLKAMLEDERHHVLFVGYQSPGTPGHAIQKYGPRGGYVDLDDKRYTIRAGVDTISGYSAHADQQDLLNFIKRMRHWPTQTSLVHGDNGAREALKAEIEAMAKKYKKTMTVSLPS